MSEKKLCSSEFPNYSKNENLTEQIKFIKNRQNEIRKQLNVLQNIQAYLKEESKKEGI